jgi:hypothetical protein
MPIEPDGSRRHLAGHDHHGNAVHVGGGDAGDGIGHAGAGGDQGHAHITGGAGIAVGCVHGSLLVAHQYMLDRILLVECVINMKHRTAGVTPDVLDTFGLQRLDQNLRTPELQIVGRGDGGGRSNFSF